MNWRDIDVDNTVDSVHLIDPPNDTPAGLNWFELIETWDRLGAIFADEEEDETEGIANP